MVLETKNNGEEMLPLSVNIYSTYYISYYLFREIQLLSYLVTKY